MCFSFCFFFTLGVVGEGKVSVQVFSRQAWSFLTDLVYKIPEKNKARAPWKKKRKKQDTHCCKTEFLHEPIYCLLLADLLKSGRVWRKIEEVVNLFFQSNRTSGGWCIVAAL